MEDLRILTCAPPFADRGRARGLLWRVPQDVDLPAAQHAPSPSPVGSAGLFLATTLRSAAPAAARRAALRQEAIRRAYLEEVHNV